MFYGQISEEAFGGGRSNIGKYDQENLKKFVEEIKRNSIKFNYILNGNCFSNLEFTDDVKRKLYNKLQWLEEIGVHMVTFSNPFFIKFCKKYFPNLKISLSVIARVNDLKQLLLWEQEGVDHITLSKDINRDFETLMKMKKYSNMELQLLVNDPCLPSCHLNNYHNQITSYASQSILSDAKMNHVSFCTSQCRKSMLEDPTNIIRAMWIRPEDIKVYEEIGISSFKLVERKESVNWIERAAKAYINRKYSGNLADLMSFFSLNKGNGELEPERNSEKIDIEKMDWITIPKEHKIDFRFKPFIDNSKLDGFIDRFVKMSCRNQPCSVCGYCSKFSEAVSIDYNDQEVVLHNQDHYIDKLLEKKR